MIAELGFLFRLDVVEKAKVLTSSWTESVNLFSQNDAVVGVDREEEESSCEDWLEKEDGVEYLRDFSKNPVWVSGGEQVWFSLFNCFMLLILQKM